MTAASGLPGAVAAMGLVLLLGAGCREDTPVEPLRSLAPAPLPSLASGSAHGSDAGRAEDALLELAPAPVFGEPLPQDAVTVVLHGDGARVAGEDFVPARPQDAARLGARIDGREVLIVPDADTFLAQVSELFAVLRTHAAEVWLQHPDAPAAYPLTLRDEEGFRAWLDDVAPGRPRIIQRADGFELATSVGKLPGPDANGPSVPVRGGRQDLATLRRGLRLLKGRFTTTEELCLVPSFGTEVAQAARALSADYVARGEPTFESLCLVYPTPPRRADGG
ncbi:hypothetical protein [Citreicoccus inhibens]|uniref:hypothetical protein n=1 Tax=Citreicoccus inhibens TaxID=2849499 RepID=UPI001F44184F|nr:hypothetical protein [Citreicoccus inhibens]